MQPQEISENKPQAEHHGGDYEPRHRDQRFGRLVMFLMTDVRRRPAFVINPPMKSVFQQAPAQEARAKAGHHNQDAATQDDRFPEYKEHHRHRIADKAEFPLPICRRMSAISVKEI